MGLVDEDDEMVGLVEEAEGFVRVVCPKALLEIKQSATRIAGMPRGVFKLRANGCDFPPGPLVVNARSMF